jgi:hypothetical protein
MALTPDAIGITNMNFTAEIHLALRIRELVVAMSALGGFIWFFLQGMKGRTAGIIIGHRSHSVEKR